MSSRQTYASAASGKGNAKSDSAASEKEPKSSQDHDESSSPKRQKTQHHDNPSNRQQNTRQAQAQRTSGNQTERSSNSSPNNKKSGAYTAAEYIRAPRHIPNTKPNDRSPSPNGDVEDHYILTLLTDQSLHDYMTALRKKYFPPQINKLDAHVTLFHALPGSKLDQLTSDIEEVCSRQRPFQIVAEEAFSPRSNNILVRASSPRFAIQGVQKMLRTKWDGFLSEQDSGGIRPHWTILNKVNDRSEVDKAFNAVKSEFEQKEGSVKGLVLWRYEKGWWKDRKVFEFRGGR